MSCWAQTNFAHHGENRGSSPLGSASKIKYLFQASWLVSNNCPINVYRQRWTSSRGSPHIHGGGCKPISSIVSPMICDTARLRLKFLPRSCPPRFFPSCGKRSQARLNEPRGRRLPCTNKRQLK